MTKEQKYHNHHIKLDDVYEEHKNAIDYWIDNFIAIQGRDKEYILRYFQHDQLFEYVVAVLESKI